VLTTLDATLIVDISTTSNLSIAASEICPGEISIALSVNCIVLVKDIKSNTLIDFDDHDDKSKSFTLAKSIIAVVVPLDSVITKESLGVPVPPALKNHLSKFTFGST